MFDESTSWYALPTPTPNSILITEYDTSEPEMIREKAEEDFETLEESPIPFRLSGLHERLSRNDQSDEERANSVINRCHDGRQGLNPRPLGLHLTTLPTSSIVD